MQRTGWCLPWSGARRHGSGPWAIRSANAGPGVGIPVQWAALPCEWRFRDLPDGDAVLPVGGTDGDEPRVATGPALELRESDGHQRAGLGHLVEVRHRLGLGIAVGEEPPLALHGRSAVGVQRLVPVEQDVALLV